MLKNFLIYFSMLSIVLQGAEPVAVRSGELPATAQTILDQSTPQAAAEAFVYAILLQDAQTLWVLLPPAQQQKLQSRGTAQENIERMQIEMRQKKHVQTARKLEKLLKNPEQTAKLYAELKTTAVKSSVSPDKYFIESVNAYRILQENLKNISRQPDLAQSSANAVAAEFIHAMATGDALAIWLLAAPAARAEAIQRCGSPRLALETLKQKLIEKDKSPKMQEIRRANQDRFLKRMAIKYITSTQGAVIKLNDCYFIDYLSFL